MSYYIQVRNFIKKNERYATPVAIFGGFVLDSLTLGRVDQPFGQILLAFYIFLIGTLIILINLIDSKEIKSEKIIKARAFLSLILMFSFGNIFSGFTLFYFQSVGSLISWFFVLILFGVLVGTEYFKHYYSRMYIQFSVFYFAIFSYLIFLVPLLIKKIGPWVFLLSGVTSLFLMSFYIFLFQKLLHGKVNNLKNIIWYFVGGVFLVVNIMYFTNIIPPIPLSLKKADVYHYVERNENTYTVLTENKSWWQKFYLIEKINIKNGASVYLFSSVFAPTKLNTQIIHEWQYKNKDGKWITSSKIPFNIFGGRDDGYRGYSVKSNLTSGKWRVNIKTPSGQTIGRKTFEIVLSDKKQNLISESR